MEDIQNLLEKINREGVQKAEAEATRIVDEAKAKAAKIIADAEEGAKASIARAAKESDDYAKRAAETISQAARDTVLTVETAVAEMLERVLVKSVDKALTDEATLTALVKDAIKGLAGGEIAVNGDKLAQALASALAAEKNFKVVTDKSAETGFSVKIDGGRVESSFTKDTIADELAKRLRPDLKKILRG